jgi:murein L,D-transpeptidase YcbB/YkuD
LAIARVAAQEVTPAPVQEVAPTSAQEVAPALPQEVAPAPPQQAMPILSALPAVSSEVATTYDTFQIKPIWFRAGPDDPAIQELISILKRATFDGFAEGPQLADRVASAVAQARNDPTAVASTDRILSTAWVRYVQAIRRKTPGMIYADPSMKPKGTQSEEIVLTASAAKSLPAYLHAASQLNPIYAQLRDAAWEEAQASGNMTPDPRLLANLDRARSIPAKGRFLLVNSGDQRLTLYENGRPIDSMKVIVGMPSLPTPLIASVMNYVTYNPYWNAPDHLVRKTIANNVLHLGLGYFKSHGYHVMVDWSPDSETIDPSTIDWKAVARGEVHLRVRQDPGTLNSMGNLKFPFPNPEDIYLHDTPGKELFAKNPRDLSNGCVRVEDARRLGRWLLGHDPVAPGTDPETHVQIPESMPIVLTYLTAEMSDGKLTYLTDIYGWDQPHGSQVAASN